MKSEGMTSKQIRYQLYRHWIRLEYGILAHNDRREIPACVEDTVKTYKGMPGIGLVSNPNRIRDYQQLLREQRIHWRRRMLWPLFQKHFYA